MMQETQIHTYHCICAELLLATSTPIERMPTRSVDGAAICKIADGEVPVPGAVVLSGSTFDDAMATVLRLEDGFEKRYAVRCHRCDLQFGYRLDKNQFEEADSGMRADVLYLLPGGLVTTEDMQSRKDMEKSIELVAKATAA